MPCADPDVRRENVFAKGSLDFQVASMVAWATVSGGVSDWFQGPCVLRRYRTQPEVGSERCVDVLERSTMMLGASQRRKLRPRRRP